MKKLLFSVITFSIITFSAKAQDQVALNMAFGDLVTYQTSRIDRTAILGTYSYSEDEKKKILEAQYLSNSYTPSIVDQYKTTAYLRYNLFNGQMEFTKGDVIYYLKKDIGRTVRFTDSDVLYKVYKVDGDLEFLMVKVEGQNSLLVKQESEFKLPKKSRSSYGYHKKADFKRKKDEYYLSFNQKEVIKVPKNKKAFFKIFKSNAGDIKNFMKKEKLSHKKIKDLEKVIIFSNTLK